ncbi:hypothetical protein HK101_007944 [Irineochytrium annulatum]|nr:hypothetical protein HK101_007944 [Irineochytrium annulatum]
MRLNLLLASSLLSLTMVSALPRPQSAIATSPAAAPAETIEPVGTVPAAAPQATAVAAEAAAPADPMPQAAAAPSEPNVSAPAEPDPVAAESQVPTEPENGLDEGDRPASVNPLDDQGQVAQAPEDDEAQSPDDDEAQAYPEGNDAAEAQQPEDEEGDASDEPEDDGAVATVHSRKLERRGDPSSAGGQVATDVASAKPANVEAAGSHGHHHHHHHHKRFHYRKYLKDRHRRRRIMRNRTRNTLLTGKKVNYGSTFYHKTTSASTPADSKSPAPARPASDLTYKTSYFSGQKGSAARQNRFRLVYLSDYHRRHRHMKVRHE